MRCLACLLNSNGSIGGCAAQLKGLHLQLSGAHKQLQGNHAALQEERVGVAVSNAHQHKFVAECTGKGSHFARGTDS